jgi:hypothetical protein
MPVARQIIMPEGWSQNKQRTVGFFFDQHRDTTYRDAKGVAIFENGRPYWAYVEKPANGVAMPMPVGEIIPIGWQAPWYAPQKYLVKSLGRIARDGNWHTGPGTTNYFRIDYAAMIKEDSDAMQAYYEIAINEAARLNITPLPQYGQPLPHNLRLVVGRPPRSPKIAEAALAGDRWLLGQQMPELDRASGEYVIRENPVLARLIKMSHETLLTPDQSEAQQVAQARAAAAPVEAPSDLMQQLQEEIAAAKAARVEMEAMRDAMKAKSKGGRPPKVAAATTVAE